MSSERLRVLIADQLDVEQLQPLRETGIEVVERAGIPAGELLETIAGFDGLLVRSRTRVTAEVLAAAPRLRVVGRAGTGVDNVDVAAATRAGVVVMNVPGGNVVAAAEHTLALMFALARHVPRAAQALREGRFEQKPFLGVELTGKTLGVVGLGRIGRAVAERARGLGMTVVAYDPIASARAAEEMGVTLLALEEVVARSDWLTVHVPLAPLTRHLVDRRLLSLARPGIRILNVARGGVLDEAALLEALDSGRVAGAALDVFEEEPPRNRALLDHPKVVATPHLGASTVEAQAGVARQIGIQVGTFLTRGVAENAVNLVGTDPRLREEIEPWQTLCRRLGGVAGGLCGPGLSRIELTVFGEVARFPREALLVEALAGVLRPVAGDRVNQVNAALFAKERGLLVTDERKESHKSFQSLVRVTVTGDRESVALDGTLFGRNNLRIVRAFGFNIDAIPEGPMLFCANDDRPGIIGHLGSVLGRAGVNIANMSVGRDLEKGHALAVLNLDQEPGPEVLAALAAAPAIRWVRHIPRERTS